MLVESRGGKLWIDEALTAVSEDREIGGLYDAIEAEIARQLDEDHEAEGSRDAAAVAARITGCLDDDLRAIGRENGMMVGEHGLHTLRAVADRVVAMVDAHHLATIRASMLALGLSRHWIDSTLDEARRLVEIGR